MTVSIESFLVLEKSLSNRLLNSWRRDAATTTREILELVNSGDFAAAVDVCGGLSLAAAAEENRRFVEFIGMQAALFGASRLSGDPRNSVFMDSGRPEEIKLASNNLIIMMEENATQSVCRLAIEMLGREQVDQQEASIQKAEHIPFPRQFVSSVGKNGKGFIDIGSSLHTSRLASWGFTIEATARGIENFQVNEQLDGRTCPVCRSMHGRKFNVAQARAKLETWMSTTNPDDMKSVAPWPSQNKKNVAQLQQMSNSQIQDKGWDTPPYHPLCRGVLVRSGSITQVEPVQVPSMPRAGDQALFNVNQSVEQFKDSMEENLTTLISRIEVGTERTRLLEARKQLRVLINSDVPLTRGQLEDIAEIAGFNKNGSKIFAGKVRRAESYLAPGTELKTFEITGGAEMMTGDMAQEARVAWAKFKEIELEALRQYTGSFYRRVNRALRGFISTEELASAPELRNLIARLKASTKKWSQMEYDTIVWRGGTMKNQPALDKLLGSTISDGAFQSTSISERFARRWMGTPPKSDAVLYEIKIPKGYDRALMMNNNRFEMEVLLAPEVRMQVVKAERILLNGVEDVLKLTVELKF